MINALKELKQWAAARIGDVQVGRAQPVRIDAGRRSGPQEVRAELAPGTGDQ